MTQSTHQSNNQQPQIYCYIISEGDEYHDYEYSTDFWLELYHSTLFSPQEFKQIVSDVMRNDSLYIGEVSLRLQEEHGFFRMEKQVCVHLSDGNEKHSKETIAITDPY